MQVRLSRKRGALGTVLPTGSPVRITQRPQTLDDESAKWLIGQYPDDVIEHVEAVAPKPVVEPVTPEPEPEASPASVPTPAPVQAEPAEPTSGAVSVADLSAGGRRKSTRRRKTT